MAQTYGLSQRRVYYDLNCCLVCYTCLWRYVYLMSGFVLYDVSLLIPYCILEDVLLSLGIYYPVFLHFTNWLYFTLNQVFALVTTWTKLKIIVQFTPGGKVCRKVLGVCGPSAWFINNVQSVNFWTTSASTYVLHHY